MRHLFLLSVIFSYGTQSLNVRRGKFKTAPVHTTKAQGAMEIQFHFLTSAQNGDEWSTSRPGRFNPVMKGRMGPTDGLDVLEYRKISCPCRHPVTYRLRFSNVIRMNLGHKLYVFTPKTTVTGGRRLPSSKQ